MMPVKWELNMILARKLKYLVHLTSDFGLPCLPDRQATYLK